MIYALEMKSPLAAAYGSWLRKYERETAKIVSLMIPELYRAGVIQ